MLKEKKFDPFRIELLFHCSGAAEFLRNRILTFAERIYYIAERVLTFAVHILTFVERISKSAPTDHKKTPAKVFFISD
jgi:hypothetical protein